MATRILYFGQLKEAAGAAEMTVDLPPHVTNAASLITFLADDDPILLNALSSSSVRIAVDHQIVGQNAIIGAPKEIAFMPPFSGG